MPIGHLLPIPEWLEPTHKDVEEANRVGRAPGLSVWDKAVTSFRQACLWRRVNPTVERAFAAQVRTVRGVGEKYARQLDVVADPLDVGEPDRAEIVNAAEADARDQLVQSAQGHSLVEGIKRPNGLTKIHHRSFREELARQFSSLSNGGD